MATLPLAFGRALIFPKQKKGAVFHYNIHPILI